MNPYLVRLADELRLYYAGGDADRRRRICLATAPPDRPTEFERRGVVLDVGPDGAFDSRWCVLPLVRKFGDRWCMYYTGRNDDTSGGLQSFIGIGLGVSDDGLSFERLGDGPVITGDRTAEFPDNRGVAGGGNIIADRQPDGAVSYRMYYTLATGRPSDDLRIDQRKHCAVCHSDDGVTWTDHRLLFGPRPEVTSEDAATACPFVWRDGELYRMLYAGIGSRWGAYSLSEAVSRDGYDWYRGDGDDNLSLAPRAGTPGAWDSEMVEYPCVIDEGEKLRLYYCGNGYGRTGIGTATAARDARCATTTEGTGRERA